MRVEPRGNERMGIGIEADFEIVGIRGRAKMITFIKRDGTRFAASYSHLHGIHLIVGGLRLEFTRFNVVVQGERLQAIHHALADHRVSFLCESEVEFPLEPFSEKAHIRRIIHTGPTRSA
jgi:hypothetical protein